MVDYVLPKLLYICLYSVLGSAIPYLSLFYADKLHLPSQQIGIILAIAPFIQSVACPFWTVQVDRRPYWHGPLMAVLMLIGGLSVIGLMFIPILLPPSTSSVVILSLTVTLAVTFAFFGQPVTVLVDSAVLKILGDNGIYYGNQRLWGSISNGVCILVVGYFIQQLGINSAFYVFGAGMVCFIVAAFFTKVTPAEKVIGTHERDPLLDLQKPATKGYYTMDPHADEFPTDNIDVGEDDQMEGYLGEHRLSIATTRADTLLIENEHTSNYLDLTRTTTSAAAREVVDEANILLDQQDHLPPLGLALSHIPTIDTSLAAIANIAEEEDISTSLKSTIFGSTEVWTFLLMTLLFGVFYSMIAQFLFLFLKQDLKLDSSVIGWTGPLGGVTEVSTFYVSRMLLKKFSVQTLVTCSHLVIMIRNVIYKTLAPNQPTTLFLALFSQLLNGFSYAMIWSTCVSEVDQMFPANQRAIAQGILAALFSGLGFGLGCILGGYAYDHYGAQALFNVSISVATLSLAVFWFGRLFKVQ